MAPHATSSGGLLSATSVDFSTTIFVDAPLQGTAFCYSAMFSSLTFFSFFGPPGAHPTIFTVVFLLLFLALRSSEFCDYCTGGSVPYNTYVHIFAFGWFLRLLSAMRDLATFAWFGHHEHVTDGTLYKLHVLETIFPCGCILVSSFLVTHDRAAKNNVSNPDIIFSFCALYCAQLVPYLFVHVPHRALSMVCRYPQLNQFALGCTAIPRVWSHSSTSI